MEDVVVAPFNNLEATRSIIDRHADELAAVIVEPVMGAAGMIPPAAGYLELLREATQTCGSLLIFDEVITLRLAWGGAQESYHVAPDITTLGKVIGGGFPVGAFGGSDELMSPYDPRAGKFFHSGTFNGNPMTMAAGLAALELLTRREITRINSLGERLRLGLRSALADTGAMGQDNRSGLSPADPFLGNRSDELSRRQTERVRAATTPTFDVAEPRCLDRSPGLDV